MRGWNRLHQIQDGTLALSNSSTAASEVSIASSLGSEDIPEALLSLSLADVKSNGVDGVDSTALMSSSLQSNDVCCCCHNSTPKSTFHSAAMIYSQNELDQHLVQSGRSLDSQQSKSLRNETTEKSTGIKGDCQSKYVLKALQQKVENDEVFVVSNLPGSSNDPFDGCDDVQAEDIPKLYRSLSDSYAMRRTRREPTKRPKSVHFADSCGYDLEIRISINDVDDYHMPPRLLEALEKLRAKGDYRKNDFGVKGCKGGYDTSLQHYSLVLNFQQPFLKPSFQERVNRQKVCLESISIIPNSLSLTGVIRVVNLEFDKHVFIRFSTDKWRSFLDVPANYVSSLSGFKQDQFSFQVIAPENLLKTRRLELAVAYKLPKTNKEFWDNDCGTNYVVTCLEHQANPCDDSMLL